MSFIVFSLFVSTAFRLVSFLLVSFLVCLIFAFRFMCLSFRSLSLLVFSDRVYCMLFSDSFCEFRLVWCCSCRLLHVTICSFLTNDVLVFVCVMPFVCVRFRVYVMFVCMFFSFLIMSLSIYARVMLYVGLFSVIPFCSLHFQSFPFLSFPFCSL